MYDSLYLYLKYLVFSNFRTDMPIYSVDIYESEITH